MCPWWGAPAHGRSRRPVAREGDAVAVRRVLVSLCLGVLVVVPAALTVADDPASPARCAGGAALELVLPGACAHVDEAPPGVDPTEPV